MTYKITATQKPTYTHFIIEGENTAENTLQYLRDIYKECTANNKRILIEERLEGKLLGTMDIYDIISTVSHDFLGFFKAIAYVDSHLENKTINFIENLGVNRSLPLRAFPTVEEAEKWLTKK